tara:strand:+ start:8359 stop:8865 length:507 start_codon:yes stop_codon:yes gene_type:complete
MSKTTQDKKTFRVMQFVTAAYCLLFSMYYIYIGKLETTDLNWLPTGTIGYTDTAFGYNQALHMLFLSIVAITLSFGLIKDKLLFLIGAVSIGMMLTLGGAPSHVAKNMTRMVGLEMGVAKVECWLPESYECNVYSKGKEPNDKYPRIWTESGVSQWAKDELAKTSLTD